MAKIYNYTCLDCDWVREHTRPQRGVRCKPCAKVEQGRLSKDPTKTTCKCGNPKSYVAKGCRACVDMKGENNPMFGKRNIAMSEMNRNRNPEDHWNWKGGITEGRDPKTISWSKAVRLDTVCDCCSFSNPLTLDAHHLEGYDSNPELRYKVSNGVCLCKNCHTVFHKTYGYGGNTTQQYLEFKENYND